MRATLLLLSSALALCFLSSPISASPADLEAGRPFLQNFGLRDYRAHNQNWSAAQDARGIMYFGNKNVVLEYDGVEWRKISVSPDTTYIRGLAFDPGTNAVYLGAVDELGYLRLNPDGARSFVSLLDKLPADARAFRDIRRVYVTARGEVFFVADFQVMRWHNGRFDIFRPGNNAPLNSHLVDGEIYLQAKDIGLLRMDGAVAVPVAPGTALFRENAVSVLLAGSSPGEFIAGAPENGLWRISADGQASPFPTAVDDFIKKSKLRRGLRLPDGTLALATVDAGFVWLGADGQFLGRVDEAAGLQNEHLLDEFLDRDGGLWLELNSGISRVELGERLTVFDTWNGLKHTTVRDVARVGGALFLAAGSGLYRIDPAEPANGAQPARAELLAGGPGCWSLCAVDSGEALIARETDIALWRAGQPLQTLARTSVDALSLCRSRRNPSRVWVGTRDGLQSLRKVGGEWKAESRIADLQEEIRTIVETADGAVWLGTPTHGVYRVTLAPDAADGSCGAATVVNYLKTNGLPAEMHWTRVVPYHGGNDVLLATQAGFYAYDAARDQFHAVTDYGARLGNGAFMLGNVAEDRAGDLWFAGRPSVGTWPDQQLGRALQGGKLEPLPERIADKIGEIEHILPELGSDGAGVVWITGTDGLVRVEVDARASGKMTAAGWAPPGFRTVLRKVSDLNGPSDLLPLGSKVSLPSERNSLRFEFAADTFRYGAELTYQTQLEGFETGGWSEYSPRTGVDYTNVPAGDYLFHVRSRDADGRRGAEAVFAFRVLPHWSRTIWAELAYAATGILALTGLVRWRLGRFRRENLRLEGRVAEQTSELIRARDAAEIANRAKSAFLANMSHELRTPLNAVLGYAQIMMKDDDLSGRNRERIEVVARSGEHLLGMINEVLDLSKIEAGRLAPSLSDFPLDRLIDDAADAFRARAAEKHLGFTLDRGADLPPAVHGDESKLRQVIFNLLGNAIKFTPSGEVHFKVERATGDRVRFEVRDTGIGIAAADLDTIFLAFHQAAGSGAALAAQGTGLGLAISQRLVAMLGGDLRVESTVGAGSRFWFELALPQASLPTASARLLAASQMASVTGYRGPRRRLLAVDDDATNRRILLDMLTPLGFEVEECASGEECLGRCERLPRLDAVLLDLRMAGASGFDVARALRRSPDHARLHLVAVSASVFESDRQLAIDAGCEDFLPKPFTEAALLTVVGRVLDLEWIAAPSPSTGEATNGAAEAIAPPAEEVDALMELSRRGDVLKIRRRLADLLEADPRYAQFVEPLAALAASYQMNRLRDALLEWQTHER